MKELSQVERTVEMPASASRRVGACEKRGVKNVGTPHNRTHINVVRVSAHEKSSLACERRIGETHAQNQHHLCAATTEGRSCVLYDEQHRERTVAQKEAREDM